MSTAAWDWRLIALSYVIAALASYTALDLADRVIKTRRAASRRAWLAGGAGVMGLGIWSMHFTGMLAYDPSMPVGYDAYLTLLSVLVAVAASWVALFAVSREMVNARRLLTGGVIMGLGIISMHYIGMEAMRMPAEIGYYPPLFALSVAIAVGASLAALVLASRFSREVKDERGELWTRAGGGLLMGSAIAGMHYTGMAAARFSSGAAAGISGPTIGNLSLGGAVGSATLVILGVALVCSTVDRRFARQAADLVETEQLYSSIFEQSVDAIFIHDDRGRIVDCNSGACRALGYTRGELLSMEVGDFDTGLLTDGEKKPGRQTLWQRAMRSEPGRVAGVHEGEHRRRDGTVFPVEVRVGSVDYRGEQMMLAAASDITERRRAEESHRAVVDTAPDAIITMTVDGVVRSFNHGAERVFGYVTEEAVGKPLKLLMPERFRGLHEQGIHRYMQTGEARVMGRTVELVGLRKSGEEFPVELSLGEMRGEEPLFIGIIRDVTERKRAEAALRESERRLAEAQSLAQLGSWDWDLATGEIAWSEQQYRAFGLDPREFGATYEAYLERVHPGDRCLLERTIEEHLQYPGPFEWEYRLVRPDGEVRSMYTRGQTVTDERGEPLRMIGTDLDITGRKRYEESRSLLASIVESSEDAIIATDLDGNVTSWNSGAQRVYGYTAEEMIGGSILVLYPPEWREEALVNIRRMEAGDREFLEILCFDKEGGEVHVSVTVSPIRDAAGNVTGVSGISRDITERKRTEAVAAEQLLQSALRADVGESLNLGGSMQEVLQRCTDAMVERVQEVSFARIWTLDEGRDELSLEANSGGDADPPELKMSTSSIVQELARTHGPFVEDDMRANERLLTRDWACSAGMNAIAAHPLIVEGNLVGVVTTLSPAPFPPRAIEAVQTMTGPIAQGIRRKWAEELLRSSEERHRTILRQIDDGYYETDLAGNLTFFNDATCRILGYPREELAGMSFRRYVDEENAGRVFEEFSKVYRTGEPSPRFEYEIVRRDGERRRMETPVDLIVDPRGEPAGFRGIVRDVTERKLAEEKLRQSEERYRAVIERTREGIFLADFETGRILEANAAFEKMLGYAPGGLVGVPLDDFVIAAPESTAQSLRYVAEHGVMDAVEREYRRGDGTVLEVEASSTTIPYEGREVACAIIRDVTGRKRLERELERRAFHDELTGLPNRALFTECLERALVRSRTRPGSLAVLFLDLDNFKFVNDSLSHDAGDRLLVEVAGRVRTCLRHADTAARLGGDEFTVVIEGADGKEAAVTIAERIAGVLREPFVVEGREIFVTFSMGIAVNTSGEEDPEDLLRDADTAMYEAKDGGKARYEIFDPGMNNRALERLELEAELRRAIERDEIVVHYQPKVTLQTGEVYGVEALARWQHPERGLVPPKRFIHIAEETGLIVPIGRRVLEIACEQTKLWRERHAGEPQAVSVNLSARQFQSPDLVESVRRALQSSGLEPSTLVLEITETVMVGDTESNAQTLRGLKALGVKLAVDDFGKGYSSLAYLKRLPVDILKIDRSFVSGLGEEPGDMALVDAMITFARTLGLSVVAEGVETAGQLANLREMGCDLAQGYYLSHPLQALGFETLLRSGVPLADPESEEAAAALDHSAGGRRAAERSRLLSRAIAASRDAIAVTDPTLPDNPLVYVNPSFERATGYSAGEAVGRNCRFLQGAEHDQPGLRGLRAALSEGREWRGVVRNYRKDGSPFLNELSISPVHDENGRLVNFIGVQNEVTEPSLRPAPD